MHESRTSLFLFGLLAIAFALTVLSVSSAREELRQFEVRDAIELSQFTEPGLVSPDGRWAVAVTQRGVFPEGVTEATVWLFNANAIKQSLAKNQLSTAAGPVPLVRLTASINGDGGDDFGNVVTQVRWENHSRRVLFLGRDRQENRQLFRVDIDKQAVTALTAVSQDVVDYTVAKDVIVYLAGPDVSAKTVWSSTPPSAPDIVVGTGRSLGDLLYPRSRLGKRYMPEEFELWRIAGADPEPVIDTRTRRPLRVIGSYYRGAMALSPDATQLVVTAHAERVPASWQAYEVPTGLDGEPFQIDPEPDDAPVPASKIKGDYTRALQYHFVDLEKGMYRPLIDAPAADFLRGGMDALQATWAPDSARVLITEAFPPVEDSHVRDAPIERCRVAVVSAGSGAFECLSSDATQQTSAVKALEWDDAARPLIRFSDNTVLAYRREELRWQIAEQVATEAAFDLFVEQSLNEPPVLVATGAPGSGSLEVFDPNPQLAKIALGDVSVYSWKSTSGQEAFGGLVKPPDFSSDRRYPLVIQTHGFPRDRFFTTGMGSNTASAGRALAARGMLVLQVREPRTDSVGTWREASERGTAVYLGAIDHLASEGLVDPAKVGVAGYSRQGSFVAKALTEAPERFAAAVVANTSPGSVFGYYTFLDDRTKKSMRDYAEFQAGTLPYSDGLQRWIERSAAYRTDRIRAPVLVSAGDPMHLLALWPLYAPLRDQGKPVELQYFRSGTHNIIKPLQVLAHQEMLVDWFDFWLNGSEDNSPTKAEQYERWRQLRRDRDASE